MRVNELSKELGKTNKEVLEILQKNQFDVKSHASSISDDQAAIVRRTLGAGTQRSLRPRNYCACHNGTSTAYIK